jgi:hypothetical protein
VQLLMLVSSASGLPCLMNLPSYSEPQLQSSINWRKIFSSSVKRKKSNSYAGSENHTTLIM